MSLHNSLITTEIIYVHTIFFIIHSSIYLDNVSSLFYLHVKHAQVVPDSERQGPIDGYTVIYNQAGSTMTTEIDVDASDFSIDILGNFVCRPFFALLTISSL